MARKGWGLASALLGGHECSVCLIVWRLWVGAHSDDISSMNLYMRKYSQQKHDKLNNSNGNAQPTQEMTLP
jgi:hypothetical protein